MTTRDTYDPSVQLENAAILFLHNGQFAAAIALFCYRGERLPHHSDLWYGLGNGLTGLAHQARSRAFLTLAVAVLRRSLMENPDNTMAAQLIELIQARSGLLPTAYEAIAPFEGSSKHLLTTIAFTPDMLVDAIRALPSWSERMQIVMWLRQQNIEEVVPLLIATVDSDPHRDVRMAALKYLGRWGARADVRTCLERLVEQDNWRELQPYVSMALRSITEEWAQRLVRQIGNTDG